MLFLGPVENIVKLSYILIAISLLFASDARAQTGLGTVSDDGPISEVYLAKSILTVRQASLPGSSLQQTFLFFALSGLHQMKGERENEPGRSRSAWRKARNQCHCYYLRDKSRRDDRKFHRPAHGNWVAGKYRADIFVQGKLATRLEFEITGSPVPAEGNGFVSSPPTAAKPKARTKTQKARTIDRRAFSFSN